MIVKRLPRTIEITKGHLRAGITISNAATTRAAVPIAAKIAAKIRDAGVTMIAKSKVSNSKPLARTNQTRLATRARTLLVKVRCPDPRV